MDKVFTNFADRYVESEILPPLGKSDHNCVLIKPIPTPRNAVGKKMVNRRVFSDLVYDEIARDLINVNWSVMYKLDDCQEQANILYTALTEIVDKHAPLQQHIIKNNDKPWITLKFKELVNQRNLAFCAGNQITYKRLRNTVNRLRKELQKKFYNDRIRNLKSSNNSKWWKQIKSMSGLKLGNDDIAAFENIVYRDAEVQISDLPDVINSFLVSVTDGVPCAVS